MAKNYDELAATTGEAIGRLGTQAAKEFIAINTLPARKALEYSGGAVRGVGKALGIGQSPDAATPVATPRTYAPVAPRAQPAAAAPLPTAPVGPRATSAPVNMSQSGYGVTSGPAITPLAPATPATPVAPAVVAGAADAADYGAQAGGRPLYAAPVAAPVAPPRAGYDASERVMWTPGMDTPAALALKQRMNLTNEARSRGFQPGSARAMQLQSQWDAATEAAFTGAMSPAQLAAYNRRKSEESVQRGAAFRNTPQFQMGEQATRRDVGIAEAQARGMIGASATKAEQERLNREALTENERMRQEGDTGRTAMTTAEQRAVRMDIAKERSDTAAELRKAREAQGVGEQIAKLYASFATVPEGTDAAKSLMSRIAKLEAQHDKMLGIVEEPTPIAGQVATAAPAAQAGIVKVQGPSGSVARMNPDVAKKYLARPGYSVVQ